MSTGVDIVPKPGDVGDVGTSDELWGNSYVSGKYYVGTRYIGVTGNRLVINNGGGEQDLTYLSEITTEISPDELASCTDITANDATTSAHGLMPKLDKIKLDGIESGATADQSDSEIETAYNNQVPVVTQVDAEAGTSTTVMRWNPLRVKQAIESLAPGGGDMLKSVYDTNDDGIVGDSDKLGSQLPSYYRNATNLNAGTVDNARLGDVWRNNDTNDVNNPYIQGGTITCATADTWYTVTFDVTFSVAPIVAVSCIIDTTANAMLKIRNIGTSSFQVTSTANNTDCGWIAIGKKT